MEHLSHAELEEALAVLATQQDMVEHRLLTLIREADRRGRGRAHGLASTAAWLGFKIGLGIVAAREKVRVANALGVLPNIDAAFAKGEVSYSKVRAMTRVATPSNEQRLLALAKQATAAQLDIVCRGVARVNGNAAASEGRWFRVQPEGDGMVRVVVRMHADEAALLKKAVDAAREGASAEALPDRVDGLVRLADAYLAGESATRTGGDRLQLVVTVQANPIEPGISAAVEGLALTNHTLKRMACDCAITAVTVDEDGDPLDVGRKTRKVPPALRRALQLRDGRCRFPGCTHERYLDAHHMEHWMDGGATSKDNLVLLCSAHHRMLHEGGFTLRRAPAGAFVFRRPDGTVIEANPRPPATQPNLPLARARATPYTSNPDYNLAIGLIAAA